MTISSILKTVALTVFLTIMQHHKFLAALPLALAVSAAWAADDGYTTLDTSVVSASGYAQDTREAPASITVIDSKELMTKPIGDIGTAVSDVPGVDLYPRVLFGLHAAHGRRTSTELGLCHEQPERL